MFTVRRVKTNEDVSTAIIYKYRRIIQENYDLTPDNEVRTEFLNIFSYENIDLQSNMKYFWLKWNLFGNHYPAWGSLKV